MTAPRRLYSYVGPAEKLKSLSPSRLRADGGADLEGWLARQQPTANVIPATFIVDEAGNLWLADRRSEHVACAAGRPVLSAGELFFDPTGARVIESSNQSTGYCPEPESWPVVAAALERIGVEHPGGFTLACLFRRCPGCGQRNLVKNEDFTCQACGGELPASWNF